MEGERALDVGSGSGYLTVCMALMVGESGKAVGIDHIQELVDYSHSNVASDKPELLESGQIKLVGELTSFIITVYKLQKACFFYFVCNSVAIWI